MKVTLTIFGGFIGIILLNFFKEGETGRPRQTYRYFKDGGYTYSGLLRFILAPSLSKCCSECYADTKCSIVGYDEENSICIMHDESFIGSALTASHNVYKYFKATCPGSSDDYSYNSELEACVSSVRDKAAWKDAVSICEDDGAHVMYVRKQVELDYLAAYLKAQHTGVKMWTGGSELGNNTYAWTSGEIIDETNGGQFWADNRPRTDTDRDSGCMRVQYDNAAYWLRDSQCNNTHHFYCQLDGY